MQRNLRMTAGSILYSGLTIIKKYRKNPINEIEGGLQRLFAADRNSIKPKHKKFSPGKDAGFLSGFPLKQKAAAARPLLKLNAPRSDMRESQKESAVCKDMMMKEDKKIKAVMTVEASLVLPLFIMLFMNILSVIEVYRTHSSVAADLWRKGREAALLGYFSEKAGIQIPEDLGEQGVVRLNRSYLVRPLFPSLTPVSKRLENHYYAHAWIGYIHSGEESGQEDTYVYIAETGTVYHRNRGCSYLNPSIRRVEAWELETLRNKSGGVYYVCPLCESYGAGEIYYVTDYGTGFHTSVSCSGLKRTIYEVKLSEAGSRGACSKCGG